MLSDDIRKVRSELKRAMKIATVASALLVSCGAYQCKSLDVTLDDGAVKGSMRVTFTCDGQTIVEADVADLSMPTCKDGQ